MDLVDVFIENNKKDIVFENEYMKVLKILNEIPVGNQNHVKRVQLVIWKSKETDIPDIDIRGFSKFDNSYKKGITLTINEAKVVYETLKDFFENKN